MRLMLTLPRPLLPADTGGKIRSLNIFKRLAQRVEIHAVSFADRVKDIGAVSQMSALFQSYTPVWWREAEKYSPRFYAEVAANQFSAEPYFLAKCNQPRLRAAVERVAHRRKCDLLFCDFLHTALPMLRTHLRPRIVFEHNVEFLLRKRKAESEKRFWARMVFGREWRKTRAAESAVCGSFEHVLAVSNNDAQTLRQEFGVAHVSTLPTGVDTDFFHPSEEAPIAGRLVFVGSMDWDPNEDGVLWFLREVYPRIRKAVPHASFAIVGRSPSARLRTLAARAPGVEVTGWVPDVRLHLATTDVVVVPLRVGGGTRIKIPEAMAMAKPVVSTTVGAEGLPFRNGRDFCIADAPEDFAHTVVGLLENAGVRQALGAAARKTVCESHGWDVVVNQTEAVLERVRDEAKRGSLCTV